MGGTYEHLRSTLGGCECVPTRDLETIIRQRQDELRGRPETWWERNRFLIRSIARTTGALIGAAIGGLILICWVALLWYAVWSMAWSIAWRLAFG